MVFSLYPVNIRNVYSSFISFTAIMVVYETKCFRFRCYLLVRVRECGGEACFMEDDKWAV